MAVQNPKFDRNDFIYQFSGALNHIGKAVQMGEAFAAEGINRILFAGCGAPLYMMRLLAHWAQKSAVRTDIRVYYSAELIIQCPAAIDEKTLVILGSHSGTTRETLEAAKFLQSKPCNTLSITQEESSPLGSLTNCSLLYGKTTQGYFSAYILAQTLFSAFLNKRENDWGFHPALMKSLPNLPAALADAKENNQTNASAQAKALAAQNLLYILGAGPMYTTAYVFAACFLMEMQWMHAHALTIADFFHGPFEMVDKTISLLLLIGEDSSQLEGERAKRFCSQYAGNTFVYDSRNFEMKGIAPNVRPIVAPFILDAALTSLVEELALIRGHPLTTRRYMGKVDY
jgi:fructoselysine 6-phosphate deglycase